MGTTSMLALKEVQVNDNLQIHEGLANFLIATAYRKLSFGP